MPSKKKFAFGLSALAVAGILASISPSYAGTGGDNAVGIEYGDGQNYCEVAHLGIIKVDATSGTRLSGAEFQIQAAEGVGVKSGLYHQGDKAQTSTDQDLWQRTFDIEIDEAFSATEFGQKFLKARVQVSESQGSGTEGPGTAEDGDFPGSDSSQGTTYTANEVVIYPFDYTAITNESAQVAAMANWLTDIETATFEARITQRLADLRAVAEDPALSNANKDTRDMVTAQVSLAQEVWDQFSIAKEAAAAGDWDTFVQGYIGMQAKDASGNAQYPFGLGGVDFELVRAVVGASVVDTANKAANDAVGATYVGDEADEGIVTLVTGEDGNAEFTVFGRLGSTGCEALGVSIVETEAPEGYRQLDGQWSATPDNVGREATNNVRDVNGDLDFVQYITIENQLDKKGPGGPEKPNPQFESGE